ncbi:MAG: VOC family protein, partial [Chloroflexi bacterium]|nr:VOC family protein [Chloroflexota bacterium]
SDLCELPERGVRVAFFPVGESQVEFVQPMEGNASLLKTLEKRGQGLHHVCMEVDDIHAALEQLKAKGVPLIDETPRPGAEGLVAFLHPKGMHGVLIELLQRDPAHQG